MEKTTLYLPAELQRSLRELSRRTRQPQARLIREAIERYVAEQEQPWPSSIGAAADGTMSARESGAWLRSEWSRPDARPIRRTRPR